jgi:transcriptional regulator with PAS, ATPase and Fis domain
MEEVVRLVRRVARSDCSVLIVGETGTGKELVARAIHAESSRRRSTFQAINCATFSATLLESQLFGHVRGAFTGAVRDQPGLFVAADGGTLFLDEVAEIPLELQGKLLRAIEEKTFTPVGSTRPRTVDVRVISATNKDLQREVAAGRFRADLSYRLRVFPLQLPPLRDRPGAVEALFWHFVEELNGRGLRRLEGVSRQAMQALRRYSWPGNVRELRSVVEYAFVAGEGPILDVAELPPELYGVSRAPAVRAAATLRGVERDAIVAALAKHKGRKAGAARELGVSRQTLWRKLRAHGLA